MSLRSLLPLFRQDDTLADLAGLVVGGPGRPRAGPGLRGRRPGRGDRPPPDRGGRARPRPTPTAWPTTCGPSSATTRSTSSRPGRRCPSSGSARASRPWAGGCGPCGGCATATRPAGPTACRGCSSPRSGPCCSGSAPTSRSSSRSSSAPATSSIPIELVARLVAMGYRREYQVEHRGELAVRGSIVDVFPSTADVPVRIDLWGDEVDRLTEFSVGDQRSIGDLEQRRALRLPGAAARPRRCGRGPPRLVGAAAVGPRAVGAPGRRPGLRRHGVLAAVAHRPTSTSCSTCVPAGRPGPAGRAPPDAGPGRRAARRGGGAGRHPGHDLGRRRPGVPPPPPAVRPAAGPHRRPGLDGHRRARRAGHRRGAGRRAGTRSSATATGWSSSSATWSAEGYRSWCAPTAGAAAPGWPPPSRDAGHPGAAVRPTAPADAELVKPGLRVVVQPLDRGFVYPALKLAVLAESDVTGRRRAHRKARPRARADRGLLRRPEGRATTSCTTSTAWPLRRHGQAGHRRRRARLPAPRVPGRRQALRAVRPDRPLRPYTGGESPALHRLGGADWQKAKGRVRSAVREIAQELVVLYRRRITSPGHAFPPDTPWQREMEASFPYAETPDQLKAIAEVKADMEEPVPMDRLVCGDVGFGKTEVAIRAAFKAVQDGKQVGGAGADHAAGLAAPPDLRRPLRRLPGPGRDAVAGSSRPAQARKVIDGLADGSVDVVIGTHRLLSRRRQVQGPRPAGGRRGAALRRHPQGGDQAAAGQRRRAHPHRHADPPHARDEPHRHPRPHPAQHPAGRPPADPHLRRRVRRPGRGRGHPPRAAPRGPGLLRAQPGAGHREGGRRGPRPGARGPGRGRPRPDGRGHPREGRARLLGGPLRRAGVHDHHRVGHRHADGQHPGRRPGRPARARPAPPAAGPGRPGRPAGLRLPVLPARPGA